MGIVYFGANVPQFEHNGNWQDINQWYSDGGYASSKSGEPSVLLGRFPNPATDRVWCLQYITSNVGVYNTGTSTWTTDGIWPGEMIGLYADKVGIFTGAVATGNYSEIRGNSSNTLPELRGAIGAGGLTVRGGLVSANIFPGAYVTFLNGAKITSTFANTAGRITISGGPSIYNTIRTEQLFLESGANVANGIAKCSWFRTQGRDISVYSDISTSNTGCLKYDIGGGNFLNTNPLIFGNTTHAATVAIQPTTEYIYSYVYYDTTYNQSFTIYGRTSSITYFGSPEVYSTSANTIFNGLITFIPITGQANSGKIRVYNGTYSPNVFINLSSYGVSTNTKIANTGLPDDLTFLTYGKFEPKVKLLNVSPGVDITSTQIS
jgi:hypothetical protein